MVDPMHMKEYSGLPWVTSVIAIFCYGGFHLWVHFPVLLSLAWYFQSSAAVGGSGRVEPRPRSALVQHANH